ncbi:MAG: hydroxyacylglutathione hydrolase [Chlorobiaceae bacterium]|nr:hydroxyacylglutathione hydrolase [Chlorobiaceae bacterium]
MMVEQFRTGGDRNFGYLCVDERTGTAFAVDPSNSPAMLADLARDRGWDIGYAFSTHGHQDHCNGNGEFELLTGVRVLLFGDRCPATGMTLVDGSEFPLGDSSLRIIHTPGHTDDSMCILCGDSLFTGDTLFVGKVGGTWSDGDARREYRSLHERLMCLPEGTKVWPGHDYGASPVSTLGHEKRTNPFLLQPDIDAFIELKRNWAAYKKAHGIS